MKTRWFAACSTLEELKKEYKRLVKIHHPDLGGDLRKMQEINAEYDELWPRMRDKHNADPNRKKTYETANEYRDIIVKLVKLEGCIVEICGTWLWVTGETIRWKEYLKTLGLGWAARKKAWYWHPGDMKAKWKGSGFSMNQIRKTFGSELIPSEEQDEMAALEAG